MTSDYLNIYFFEEKREEGEEGNISSYSLLALSHIMHSQAQICCSSAFQTFF